MGSMILKVFSSLGDSVILKQLGFSQGPSPCACRRARSLFGVSVTAHGCKPPLAAFRLSVRHSSGRISSWKGWSGPGAAQEGVDVALSAQGGDKLGTGWAQSCSAAGVLGAVTA